MKAMNSKDSALDTSSPIAAGMPGKPPSDGERPIGSIAASMTSGLGEGLLDIRASASNPAAFLSTPQPVMMPGSVLKIPVAIQVVIGSARVPLSQVAQLGPGAMITLDQKLGTPAVILVNGREVARGELFVFDGDGDRLGITITEVNDGSASTTD